MEGLVGVTRFMAVHGPPVAIKHRKLSTGDNRFYNKPRFTCITELTVPYLEPDMKITVSFM
jgi:hypothetical protein